MSSDIDRPDHWSTWDGTRVTCQACGASRPSTVQGQAWASAREHAARHEDVRRCTWCDAPSEFYVGAVRGMYTGVGTHWPAPAAGTSRFVGDGHWRRDLVCDACLEASDTVIVLRPSPELVQQDR